MVTITITTCYDRHLKKKNEKRKQLGRGDLKLELP